MKLTNPNKILFPEDKITKLQLANYYEEVQDWILPFLVNRPLTLVRCPEIYTECFYQKHINKNVPEGLFQVPIKGKEGTEDYVFLKNNTGLLALIQLGVLEIHPWGSKVNKIEFPDYITFDLDPSPEIPWKTVVKTALLMRDHLKDFKLTSFVKTTGGKGLHVVVPIKPQYSWEKVKLFSEVFVKFMISEYPNQYINEASKAKRKGKIFIDYLRNVRGATAVAAYSTRARIHAPISTPLHWDELSNDIKENTFTIFTILPRLNQLKKDPWEDFFKIKQSLRLDKL